MPERLRSSKRVEIGNLADELDKLGLNAAVDAKILSDLRMLHRHLGQIVMQAAADSPVVAERKRRGRISYLEAELARLREGDVNA